MASLKLAKCNGSIPPLAKLLFDGAILAGDGASEGPNLGVLGRGGCGGAADGFVWVTFGNGERPFTDGSKHLSM